MLKDLLFPRLCLSCGFLGGYICKSCRNKLFYIKKDSCLYCKKESYLGLTHPNCKSQGEIDGFITCFYYEQTLKKIIKAIKYRLVKEAIPELFNLIDMLFIGKINKLFNSEFLIQAMPLTKKRLKERGFNLAEKLGVFIGGQTNLPLVDFLERVGDSSPQAQIKGKKERQKNVRGCFRVENQQDIKNKTIILVDDVLTTGATAGESAVALKLCGAKKVFVLTIAKG